MNRRELAQLIDHTALKPEATWSDVDRLVAQGLELGVHGVCVAPSFLPLDAQGQTVVTVVGFPSGAHYPEIKAAEAARAAADGAHEVDMAMNLGRAKAAEWSLVSAEIAAVRAALPEGIVLKVIIESAALTDAQIVAACWAAEDAGANWIKTSTGFHPAGGATVHAVDLIARTVRGRLGVKASGGITTLAEASAMINAGASRIGTSHTAEIVAELAE
ncbi:MAG: deoxyribose-phosphate aldolase [Bifidobacteriaceae bacterium]|nr:deoxyribose-phosphate aldolase [Bifidobacteriaceae bacterium]